MYVSYCFSFHEVFVVAVLDAILDFFARGESFSAPIQVDHANFFSTILILPPPQPRRAVFCLDWCRQFIELALVKRTRLQPHFVASGLDCALGGRYCLVQIGYLGDLESVPRVESAFR